MKICAIPFDIVYASPEENIIAVECALRLVEPDTDLVVLPELFTTAFVPDIDSVEKLAESNDGTTVESLRRWAKSFGFAVAGSFLATDGAGHYFNRGFFMEPSGTVTFYDKRHLFPLSTEDKVYTPGRDMAPRISYLGWVFRIVICFDIRFPVWTRNRPDDMYDVLIVPSNWPHSRADQFKILLAARAVENQIYVVGADRSGKDAYGEYLDIDSGIYENLGKPVHDTRKGLIYAVLDKESLHEGRRRFPAYVATDKWSIEL